MLIRQYKLRNLKPKEHFLFILWEHIKFYFSVNKKIETEEFKTQRTLCLRKLIFVMTRFLRN